MRWLKKEAIGKQVYFCIVGFSALILFLSTSFINIAQVLGIKIPPIPGDQIPILTFSFPFWLFSTVLFEEFLFRLPLAFFLDMELSINKVLIMAIFSSTIFGFLHGGIIHIFIQGVAGFLWCILFLKCGGLNKNYAKAFCATTISHFLFDIMISVIILIEGGNSI